MMEYRGYLLLNLMFFLLIHALRENTSKLCHLEIMKYL